MNHTVSAHDDDIADEVLKWLGAVRARGTGVAVLEGLPGAGKSTILTRIKPDLPCYIVELDDLLLTPEPNPDRTWMELVLQRGALAQITKWALEGFTLVEGPAAWPIVREWAKDQGAGATAARSYLKAVSKVGGVTYWDAGDGLREHAAGLPALLGSIYEYHADERPWEGADIVFERIAA